MAQKKAAELEERLNTLEGEVGVLRANMEERFSSVYVRISDVERKVDDGFAKLEALILSMAKPTQPGPTESTNVEERAPASLPLTSEQGKGVMGDEVRLDQGIEARPLADLTQPSQGDKFVGAAVTPAHALVRVENTTNQQQGRVRPSPNTFPNSWGVNQHMFSGTYEQGEPSIHDFHQDVRFHEGRNIRNFQPDYGANRAAPTRGLGAPYGNNQPRPPARDFDTRIRKLDMPIFEGLNAEDWIYKAERYFWVNNIQTDAERINAAALCLEGRAFSWFRWCEERQPIYFWAEFRERILRRFNGQHANKIHERFFSLTQETTVEEYRDKFEALASGLGGISDEALMGNFMKGLKPTVRAAVRVLRPRGLDEAMTLAQLVEEQARAERPKPLVSNFQRNNLGNKEALASDISKIQEQPRAHVRDIGQQQGFKRMSESDIQAKRAKGLCYRCEERWAPGHRCHPKALQVIIINEDEDDHAYHLGPEANHENQMDSIALNSISGLTPSPTMTLGGWLNDREVVVMIDSGATHNFISQQLAKEEGIPIIDKGQFEVTLATGEVKESRGYCPNVELDLPRYKVTSDFLPLNIKGADIILGVQWLQTLGDVKTNWQSLQMEFHDAGKKIQLYGEPELTKGEATIMAQSIKATSFEHVPTTEFIESCAQFNLEDKVALWEGSIDRTSDQVHQIGLNQQDSKAHRSQLMNLAYIQSHPGITKATSGQHGLGTFKNGLAEPSRASWHIIGHGQARDNIPYAWDQGARAINAQEQLQGYFIEESYADLAKDEFDHYSLGQHWIPSLKEGHKEQQRPP